MQINVKNLSYIYNHKTAMEFKALNDVSVSIMQGEFVGIIGPTGSGKTTFVQHLNALLTPHSGEIILANLNNWNNYKKSKRKALIGKYNYKITKTKSKFKQNYLTFKKNAKVNKQKMMFDKLSMKLKTLEAQKKDKILNKMGLSKFRTINNSNKKIKNILQIRSKIGIVFQFAEYQLFEETIVKDIMFGPLNLGLPYSEAFQLAKDNLKLVGLPESYLEKSPFELSGGEKRRVAIAGILAMEPDFLIFDEPTAGLDPVGCEQMLKIFRKLNDIGKTVIIVTHNLDHVLEVTKRTMLFSEGKLIRVGDTYSILNDIEFLVDNNMQPPKLLSFVNTLEKNGLKIGKIKSIEDLVKKLKGSR